MFWHKNECWSATRQFFNIVHGVYAVINFHAVTVIITCVRQATQFFTYLQIKLLLRTRLPHMTSPQLEIHFMWLFYVHVENPMIDFEFY